jgi:hypothetical protein
MKLIPVMLALLWLGACSTPAIVGQQLDRNAAEMLNVDEKLLNDCVVITTVTQTPSSWWSWVAPVRQVTTTLECNQ